MAVVMSCQSLSKTFGARVLFDNLTFGLDDGERMGLIGPNGSGKSTLLKILAGVDAPDSGNIVAKRNLRIGYVPQEDVFDLDATAERVLVEAAQAEHLDEREQASRVNTVIGRVGLTEERRAQRIAAMSGGWRKRLSIARQLVRNPELLLMDEPTNHLDLDGIVWLEKLLANAPFAALIVSHDRFFLENATNRIFELNRAYPDGFFSSRGGYADFVESREEFLSGQLKTQRALESQVRREAEWLKRGPPGRTTKQRARIDEAGRLMSLLSAARERNRQHGAVKIDFNATERTANKLLTLKNVSKSMGGRPLIQNLSLVLSPGSKLGLLGGNGSGKTTLLRLFAGELMPDSGTIERAERLEVVYFDQAREQLDREATLRRALSPLGDTVTFRGKTEHVSGWAKRFLFKPEQLEMPVKNLSGGEQARILIARLMLRPADILLLDEPTNDLDIPSLEVLEESLADFPGALVLVTHDRYMLSRVSTEIVGLDGKGGARVFTDYLQWENAQQEEKSNTERSADPLKNRDRQEPRPQGNGKSSKRLSYKEQREWDEMEANILAAEADLQAIQKEVEDPALASDPKKLHDRCAALADAHARVDGLYARWQELEEKQK
ncbi:MAG TPA: ABC-F family ATP-binding cassette domain-containing protein [Planctomycetota bacterium]|nr:ABC-F family ATP-binding cassette domain-containing protein [Planctomycetota bacterium]